MIINLVVQIGLISKQLGELLEAAEASASARTKPNRASPPASKHHRLREAEVDRLVADYEAGSTVNELAIAFDIHRTTVMAWLKRRKVKTRRSVRKLTDAQVADAARLHELGSSIAVLAEEMGVDAETLRRQLTNRSVRDG